MLAALLAAGFFSTLAAALVRSHPARILERAATDARRKRLEPLLERVDTLTTSASILRISCELMFMALLISYASGDGPVRWTNFGRAFAIGAPIILLTVQIIPNTVAQARGDVLLLNNIVWFHLLQLPLVPLVVVLDGLRRAVRRVLGLPSADAPTRRIVAGLRDVIEDADIKEDLSETEREMIENVMEFRDVDVAAVMTPRTEIHAVNVDAALEEVVGAFAEAGHSRIPVYDDSIDTIIGTVSALEVTKAVAEGRIETTALRDLLRPAFLVPETKRVSELLAEFRQQKQKMAIVVDEYGGTAGMVTLGDVTAEIVGDVQDEYEQADEAIRMLENGVAEVQAGLHVTEVNEALDLEIPEEEDFETLGGFVLAELGHLPRNGESFTRGSVRYSVAEASDRRVLKVTVSRSA